MRISTEQIYKTGTNNMLSQQQKVLQSQAQLANNGQRVNTASDDPVASAQIEMINQTLSMSQIYKQNNQAVNNTLSFEDGVLASVVSNIQSLQQLQVQASSTILSLDDRKALATQAQTILNQLVGAANTTGLNGEYIFSGSKSDIAPISKNYNAVTNTTTFNYNGDDVQRFQSVSDGFQVALNDTAQKIFMNIPGGNGSYTINQTANPNNGTLVVSSDIVSNPASFIPGNYTLSVNSNTITVTDAGGNTVYNNAYQDGEPISFNGISFTLSGAAADGETFSIQTGATNSLFATVQNMIQNLNAPYSTDSDKAAIQNQNSQISNQLQNALTNISKVRADLGGRLNQLTSVSTTMII